MGWGEKIKKIFVDEVEEDDEDIKKEVFQVPIKTPKVEEEHEYEPNPKYEEGFKPTRLEEQEEVKEVKKEEPVVEKKYPKFFEDDDFEMPDERIPEEKHEYKYTRTETIVKPNSYGIKKEEKKIFTPTPIISPVYGVLDKNYKKEEIKDKKRPTTIYSQFDKIDVDDIRKKAYGTLEDELQDNMTSNRDAIIFNDDIDTRLDNDKEITDYEEQPLDIFKELEKKDALDDLLDSYNLKDEDTLDTELLLDNEDTFIEDELNRDYDTVDEDGLEEDDLFNLIDSMYNKED